MDSGSLSGGGESRLARVALTIIAVIMTAGALKVSVAVSLPLAFSIFLIALFWPLHRRLERWMPAGLAAVLTMLAFLGFIASIIGGLVVSGDIVSDSSSGYREALGGTVRDARSWVESHGLPWPSAQNGKIDIESLVVSTSKQVFSVVGGVVLVAAFLVLGLLEVYDFKQRVRQQVPGPPQLSNRWLGVAHDVARDFQRYVVVRTVIGVITGIAAGVICWLVGLDFAFIWGLVNFLLNYIPTIGSIVGVIPPTLFALVQFGPSLEALLVLVGVGGVQLVMGNYIDPLLQGKYLRLSPFVVLLSVVFWGWVWGIAGAFLSVPATIAIALICKQFDRSRWVAVMLTELEDTKVPLEDVGSPSSSDTPSPAAARESGAD